LRLRFCDRRTEHSFNEGHFWRGYPEPETLASKEDIVKRTASTAFLLVLLGTALPASAAQRDHPADTHPEKAAKKTIRLSCRVGLDGKTVVSDRDSRVWKVLNAEMLSGSEGRMVRIKAYTETDSSEIRVMVVRLQEERTTAKLDDAAFRR